MGLSEPSEPMDGKIEQQAIEEHIDQPEQKTEQSPDDSPQVAFKKNEPGQLRDLRRKIGEGDPGQMSDGEKARRYIEYANEVLNKDGKLDPEMQKTITIGVALVCKRIGDELGFRSALNQLKILFGTGSDDDCVKVLDEIELSENEDNHEEKAA